MDDNRYSQASTGSAYFPALGQLIGEILQLASNIGQTARNLRARAPSVSLGQDSHVVYLTECRSEVAELQQLVESTRSSLKDRFPDYSNWLNTIESLPPRIFAWVQHVCSQTIKRDVIADIPRDIFYFELAPYMHTLACILASCKT